RHLRAVGRILRRLLRQGAECPDARAPRVRRRVRARRSDRRADDAERRVQARREGRPAVDVPQRRLHDSGQPVRDPRDLGAVRLQRDGAADRPAGARPPARRGSRAARGLRLRAGDYVAVAPSGARVSPAATPYETVIGLEVHAQLSTRSKMFCGCPTTFGAPPNSQTCPVCQGMPGVLPVVNRRAVEFGIRTALAFNCRVNPACRFARKHYYYPDMPKNYQISQYEEPLAEDGFLDIEVDGAPRRIGIQRLHLEEDVGKLR